MESMLAMGVAVFSREAYAKIGNNPLLVSKRIDNIRTSLQRFLEVGMRTLQCNRGKGSGLSRWTDARL